MSFGKRFRIFRAINTLFYLSAPIGSDSEWLVNLVIVLCMLSLTLLFSGDLGVCS